MAAETYGRHLGRHSAQLSAQLAEAARELDPRVNDESRRAAEIRVGRPYVTALAAADRDELRARCQQLLPSAPFTVDSVAWAARGTA